MRDMSRADKRKTQREMKKRAKVIDNLSPRQIEIIDSVAKERAKAIAGQYVADVKRIIEDSMCCVLYDLGLDAAGIMDKANMMAIRESLYIDEEGIEMDKKITREMIINSARKHGLSTEGRRKIAKELKSTYSTITTYVSRWKITEADLNKPVMKAQYKENVEEDPDVQDAMEKIADILGEGEEMKMENKEVEKVLVEADKAVEECKETVNPVVATKATVQQANLNPQEESKLQVLAMTLKGENGVYRVCSEGVELTRDMSMMFFENANQLDKFTEEYKKVFEIMKA